MSNVGHVIPKQTFIPLKDGTEIELFFSMYAMAKLEEKYGSIAKAMEYLASNEENGQMQRLIEFLELGLMHYDEPVDMVYVTKNLSLKSKNELMEALVAALGNDGPVETIPKN